MKVEESREAMKERGSSTTAGRHMRRKIQTNPPTAAGKTHTNTHTHALELGITTCTANRSDTNKCERGGRRRNIAGGVAYSSVKRLSTPVMLDSKLR